VRVFWEQWSGEVVEISQEVVNSNLVDVAVVHVLEKDFKDERISGLIAKTKDKGEYVLDLGFKVGICKSDARIGNIVFQPKVVILLDN